MLWDQRDYRAVAVTGPGISDLSKVLQLLPSKGISKQTNIETENSSCAAVHVYYHSRKVYGPVDPGRLRDVQVRRGKTIEYRYDIYVLGMRIEGCFIGLIAMPFVPLALDVFDKVRAAVSTTVPRFCRIEIRRLVNAVTENRHAGGNVKLTRVEMQVENDERTNLIVLGGADVPHSRTYHAVLKTIRESSVTYRKCKLRFDNREGRRIGVEMDRFGNFSLRVARGGRNLATIHDVFEFLKHEDLIVVGLQNPILRLAEGLEESKP